MAYGATRYIYNNFVTATSMITADSQAPGMVSGSDKIQGTLGTATMVSYGSYTGTTDLRYTVQIDALGTGEVGSSTFRWKTSDTAVGSWEATGVTTASTPTLLSAGVYVFFTGGDGADFELNDTWICEAQATYSPAHLIDWQRNTIFRSGTTFDIEFNLGSAQQVTVVILHEHNLTAATSTVTLQANTSSSWGAPPYTLALTITDPLIIYLDQTYQYWRLAITESALSYIEIAQVVIGEYLQLTYNAKLGTPLTHGYHLLSDGTETGIQRRKAYTQQRRITAEYTNLPKTDIDLLVTMQEALIDLDTGIVRPLYFHLFYDEPTRYCFLMDWQNIDTFAEIFRYYLHGATTLELAECVSTRV